ncbi:hypothetical protein ACHAWF_002544 [Thalassiosira exigua]
MTITEEATPETVKVVAPSTLNEGYEFDVTVDGATHRVAVPPGGVTEGETFDAIVRPSPLTDPEIAVVAEAEPVAPSTTTKAVVDNPDGTQTQTEETVYADGRTTKAVTTIAAGAAAAPAKALADAPSGAWRHDLFSCCDVCGSGTFWMAWCCTYIALGQLLQRLKMNFCGQRDPNNYKNTCMIWTVVWAVVCALYFVIVSVTQGYGVLVYYVLAIFAIVAITQARAFVREKWSIPADCCEGSGMLSDCCCAWWCTCCTVVQMMRHTHDEQVHRYNCGSATGLDDSAPEVV